jgi:hypothetical protein
MGNSGKFACLFVTPFLSFPSLPFLSFPVFPSLSLARTRTEAYHSPFLPSLFLPLLPPFSLWCYSYKPSTHDDHSPPFTCAYHNASLQTSKQQPKECPHHSKKSCHKSHKKRSPEEAIIARNQWSNTKKLQAEEGTKKEFSFSKR